MRKKQLFPARKEAIPWRRQPRRLAGFKQFAFPQMVKHGEVYFDQKDKKKRKSRASHGSIVKKN